MHFAIGAVGQGPTAVVFATALGSIESKGEVVRSRFLFVFNSFFTDRA